jgi:hypothetical protein
MSWRNSTILMLVMGVFLAFATAGIRHVKHRSEPRSTRIPRDCVTPRNTPPVPRASSFAAHSPWRRLKSVLEETSDRISQEADLGPVVSPNHVIALISGAASLSRTRAPVPLRC